MMGALSPALCCFSDCWEALPHLSLWNGVLEGGSQRWVSLRHSSPFTVGRGFGSGKGVRTLGARGRGNGAGRA